MYEERRGRAWDLRRFFDSEFSVLAVINDSFYEEWFAQPVFRLVYETTYAEHQLVWGVLWETDSDE